MLRTNEEREPLLQSDPISYQTNHDRILENEAVNFIEKK